MGRTNIGAPPPEEQGAFHFQEQNAGCAAMECLKLSSFDDPSEGADGQERSTCNGAWRIK